MALANRLLDEPMPRRFHAEPMVRATELLLQERMPPDAPLVQPHGDETALRPAAPGQPAPHEPAADHAAHAHPRTHLLSNGQYHVMVTNAGGGCSTCRGLDVTRWREDRTRDDWGQFCYIRDLQSGPRLVGRLSAGLPDADELRGHLLRRQGRVPPRATA